MQILGKEISPTKLFWGIGGIAGIIVSFFQLYDIVISKVSLSEEQVKEKARAALLNYEKAINTHSFDAYELFDGTVERFITMKNVSPAEINQYIETSYYKEFINPTITFDMNTLKVNHFDRNGAEIDIIQNDDFYRHSKQRKERHKTKLKVVLTKDFKIRVFDLYHILK